MIKQKNTDIFLIIYPQQKIPWKTLKNHHSPVSNGSTIALDSGSPETPEPARFRITNPSPGGWWFGRLGSTWIHFLGWLGRLGRLGLSIYDDLCNTADDGSFFFGRWWRYIWWEINVIWWELAHFVRWFTSFPMVDESLSLVILGGSPQCIAGLYFQL